MAETHSPTLGQSKPKHAGGRPTKITEAQRKEVFKAFANYIIDEEDPTIVGFCAYSEVGIKYWLTKDNMYDWTEFSELRKRAIQKQEAYLLRGAQTGRLNPVFSIFRLKQPQHGYSDQRQVENSGEQRIIVETRKVSDANTDD